MSSTPLRDEASRVRTPLRASAAPEAAQTPRNRRAISAEPPSSRRSALRTPLDRAASRDLLNSVRRGVSAADGRRQNVPTPHAAAARRALDQRRTALLTPGKARRQSLMEQRETPMNVLHRLGRALAKDTEPIASSSSPRDRPSSTVARDLEDDDSELPILPPRLSLPIGDEDEEDLLPPQSRGLEDTMTVPGVELPRRALSEQPILFSRSSFNDVRGSDAFGSNDDTEPLQRPSDFFPGLLEDIQAGVDAGADSTFNRIDIDDRRSTRGRQSEMGLAVPPDVADHTTFVLSPPALDGGATSPMQDRSVAESRGRDSTDAVGRGDVTFASDISRDESRTDIYNDAVPESLAEDAEQEGLFTATELDVVEEEEEEAEEDEVDGGFETREPEPSSAVRPRQRPKTIKRQKRISKHGIEYPALPPSFVKRVAQTALHSSGLSNPRVSTDTLTALTQASEWFFEQVGDDLGAYAAHAKRNDIEESDMATLMRRQRQITSEATMFSLAQRHLPRELLQELKMPAPPDGKIPRKRVRQEETESTETTSTPGS